MTDIATLRATVRDFTKQVKATQKEVRELDRLAERYVAVAHSLGLPPNINSAISQAMRLKIALETLYRTAIIAQTVSGPIGWASLLAGGTLGVLMIKDTMEMQRPRY